MKPLSASQAAKAVGKSVPTITRAIKSGKLSAKSLDGGGYEIDPAELFRVWDAVKRNPDTQGNALGHETPNETEKLQAQIDALTAEKIASLERSNAELREERDKWQAQAERALRLLTDERVPVTAPQKPAESVSWFSRLLGAGKPQNVS